MTDKNTYSFTVNGKQFSTEAHPLSSLLAVLRYNIGLTGTKEGCGEGECGACSVFLDDVLVNSCLLPISQCSGKNIETIEAEEIRKTGILKKVQEAFLQKGGAQCGICTPGMVLAAVSLLKTNQNPTRQQIRVALAGNLCRCTGYMKIFDSVLAAAKQVRGN